MPVDNYITGSSGFIGSHLLKRLQSQGQTNGLMEHDNLTVALLNMERFKRFFFLSTYGNLAHQHGMREIFDSNVAQPAEAAFTAIPYMGKFVFFSTSSVHLPVQTPYSRCKKATEEVLLSLADQGHQMIIIRPYSVTGVNEQPEHLIPKLIHSCFTGEEMPFAPDATHDWIDVEDVVDGMLLLSEKAERGIYELGNGFPVKNLTVRKWVEDITGKEANCVPWAGRSYDSDSWYSKDVSALRLGWHPKRTLNQSIESMVEDYLKNEPAKTQVC